MAVSTIIAEIDAQIAKLQQARTLLAGTLPQTPGRGRPKGSKNAVAAISAKTSEARCALTLIGNPKLFTGGEERSRNCSPQPTVNNFAPMILPAGNNFGFGLACAGPTPDWEDELAYPNVARLSPELRSQSGALTPNEYSNVQPRTVVYKGFAESKPA